MTTAAKSKKETYEEKVLKEVGPIVKAILLEQVIENTPGLDAVKSFKMPASATKDPKAKALEDLLVASGNAYRDEGQNLARILEVALDIKLDYPKQKVSALTRPFMLVVPVTNAGNYTVGNVCMFRNQGGSSAAEIVKGKVRLGDQPLPTSSLADPSVLRFPSMAEAHEFVGKAVSSLDNINTLRSWIPQLDALLDKA